MKIGLIKETKWPVDNRVALSPKQVADLNNRYPQHEIVVQASDVRAYSDDEYLAEGVHVVDHVDDCEVLFGIKEANIESLIPNKHYFFFGHIAKMQPYNRPLLQAMIQKRITFSDYEYLVDDEGIRVCAFGWWAGVVGVYYTLRGYSLRNGNDSLPKPDLSFTKEQLLANLKNSNLPAVKILVTGTGRVSTGAQFVLKSIGAKEMTPEEYLNTDKVDTLSYCVASAELLVLKKDGTKGTLDEIIHSPELFKSDFMKWAIKTDILMCCHFWSPKAPVYLSEEDLRAPKLRIKMIGDVSCDIMGSVKSTLRSSTHAEPYYDYVPSSAKESPAFSSDDNITIMAVDTCPNALAMDTSIYFGEMLIKHVFEPLLKGENSDVIDRSMILKNGELTPRFDYLFDFAMSK